MQNVKTIRDFVTCIKELENDSYNKLFNLERRGIKKFEPILNSEKCYDSQNINNNNKPQEANKINYSSNQKSKKIPIPKQNQISTKSKSRNQPKKHKNCWTIPKNLKQSKKCKLNPTQIKKKNPSTNTVIPWLKWENNSCRYDSFLCLFTFNIYHNPTPTYIRKNWRQNTPYFKRLIKSIEKILDGNHTFRTDLWTYFYKYKIDSKNVGYVGFITELFSAFHEVNEFKLTYKELKSCERCKLFEDNKCNLY